MFWKKKKLYCLKFNKVRLEQYINHIHEACGEFVYEYVLTRTKEQAIKKSKLIKLGIAAFISIREMTIN